MTKLFELIKKNIDELNNKSETDMAKHIMSKVNKQIIKKIATTA